MKKIPDDFDWKKYTILNKDLCYLKKRDSIRPNL